MQCLARLNALGRARHSLPYSIFCPLHHRHGVRSITSAAKSGTSEKKYSDTLLLPKTGFPLRSDAAKREHLFRDRCTSELYQWQRDNNPGPSFVLHDGPPYANGNLHIGHALNKVLKDIIIRYKMLKGYRVNYIPGWDCHGLPIELKALSELKHGARSMLSPNEIRETARQCALNAIQIQKKEFMDWGVMGDWDKPYRTLDKDYEVRQLKVFYEMMKKGYIYRQYKPVYWSPSSKTALAEAELEYRDDHRSQSIYTKFPIVGLGEAARSALSKYDQLSAVIWTTTPWTIPANRAIAVNPDMLYSVVVYNGEAWLVASERLEALRAELGGELEIVKSDEIKGSDLVGSCYKHPFTGAQQPILAAGHVTSESGTGLVHTAPGHGMEDYLVCKQVGIEAFCPVDEHGVFTSEAGPQFEGKSVFSHGTSAVIEELRRTGHLLFEKPYVHKYPYDWRTKKPVILRATAQWFADVSELRDRAVERLQDVKMVPESALNRLTQFTLSRSEWCISRQRAWGVPIPVLYRADNGEPLLNDASVRHVINVLEEHGTDAWWAEGEEWDERFVPPEYKVEGTSYIRGRDTMDVWFDSGTSWSLLAEGMERGAGGETPVADLYLEGSDQHRGWFQSSLLTSVAVTGRQPFGTLLTHGFVLDEQGRKMSKSIGNVVDPAMIIRGGKDLKRDPAYGVDVLRLWVASTEYARDVSIGKTVIAHISETLRKFRNTARFMLGNLHQFQASELSAYEDLLEIDKYLLHELYHFNKTVQEAYEQFAFNKVYQSLSQFTGTALSSFYFDIIKDRLYADDAFSRPRQAAQTVLYHILHTYTLALAPITPHLSEEIYEHLRGISPQKQDSVFRLGWYPAEERWNDARLSEDWEVLKRVRGEVNQVLERARQEKTIGSSLEADVVVVVQENSRLADLLRKYEAELRSFFIVSDAALSFAPSEEGGKVYSKDSSLQLGIGEEARCRVEARRARRSKCPRCWNYAAEEENALCARCQSVVRVPSSNV
ncbi:uncharacterized protein VTP21DRAFT_1219 [Calcarisporiella thermophila]|uniref:uncharacterized protein n=1 Tax=Calcarisporiella thermophila TaxID=911321 RepID=UPI0037437A70